MSRRKLGFIAFVLLVGAAFGSLLGKLIGFFFPDGVVKQFFLLGITQSYGPGTLDLHLFSVTFGLSFDFNIVGAIGIFIAIYLLRWVLN